MGARSERLKRAVYVGRVARRSALLRVLRELGVWGNRPATREGAAEFRRALEELGTTYIELGQLLRRAPTSCPNQLFAWLYTQLEPLGRMPRRVGHLVNKLETGTFKVGVAASAAP